MLGARFSGGESLKAQLSTPVREILMLQTLLELCLHSALSKYFKIVNI